MTGKHYTGQKFKCPKCKRMISRSALSEHKKPDFNCTELIPTKGGGARRPNANQPLRKIQIVEKTLRRKMFGETELIFWDEKNRWTLPEDSKKIAKSRLGDKEFEKRKGEKVYGGNTKEWKGSGTAFTEKASIELWCNNEIDTLKEVLNGFSSRTDIKVVMDCLGWASRDSRNWREAYDNFSNDYPIERFSDQRRGRGHGGENSNFSVSKKEHARRIAILESLPDDCGKDGINRALGGNGRRKMYSWVQGNYPDVDRLVPNIPLASLTTNQIRHALMNAYEERGWTRRTRTDICCEVGCEEKSSRWYRCDKHADEYIDAAFKTLGEE